MTTLTLTITIASNWPTSRELADRRKLEAALDASKIGRCTGAGAGRGMMDITYIIADDSLVPEASAKIEAAMASCMSSLQYKIENLRDPVRTFQIKVSDIFAIPLTERKYVPAICRFVFERYPGLIACRILDMVMSEPKFVQPFPTISAFDPLFVWDHSIADGTWPIIGSTSVEMSPLMYRSAGSIYNGENYLKPTDYSEDVPNLIMSGPVATEKHLRQYFKDHMPAPDVVTERTSR